MRENERNLRKTNRELDADRRQLERKEKELELENQEAREKRKPRSLRHSRQAARPASETENENLGNGSEDNSCGCTESAHVQHGKDVGSRATSTKTMKTMQKQMPLEKLAKDMREFEIAQEKMGMTDEIVNDTMDSILDESGDEEEQDAIVNQVLDEIGIDLNARLSLVPKASGAIGESSKAVSSEADLERMLANLRG
ncbi:hypothetical protein L596_009375 [Steinernema carpocapsae]|uniref:Uncharacterized protein n=1 Tax=Steinernema carpocapsae TaxID=34508 RepID=A0A4U5PF74_STECR|nr:hypothetical protein L596_009375 [Steinernema carpocapsae]